jgi:hypothetical protein
MPLLILLANAIMARRQALALDLPDPEESDLSS